MSIFTDTIAALATPSGTSAIALVRVSGPLVPTLTAQIFSDTPPPRVAQHADYRDLRGILVDDVLFTRFAAPNSFTGEDSLEISCHGNPFIIQRILEDLWIRGCQPAEAGEFSKRAFLNGRIDLIQAEAIMDLIGARSDRALAAANQQLRGGLGRRIDGLLSQLVDILARVEAYIDFPDEDLPAADRKIELEKMNALLAGTKRLLATSHYGELLRDGIKTVIIGAPNAGKSSLLNQLVGRERALVDAEPGTTRDYIEERLENGGHWLRLIDTAGLNEAPGLIEKRGIQKTIEQAGDASLFLWVVDSTNAVPALPLSLEDRMTSANTLVVQNKADLVRIPVHFPSPRFPAVAISALTGAGMETLREKLSQIAGSFCLEPGDELIAINARHANALRQAVNDLESSSLKMTKSDNVEMIASDLRGAMDALGQISGRIDNERVLDQLFANFCIGK